MLVMNLILIGSMYLVFAMLYFFLKLEISDRKATVLGIAISEEMRKTPEVTGICQRYLRELRRILGVLTVFPVTFFWAAESSFTFYILMYMIWVFLAVGLSMYPCAKYGEQLKELKRKNGWSRVAGTEYDVDFSIAAQPVRAAKKWVLAVFCMLSLLPAAVCFFRNRNTVSGMEEVLIQLLMASTVWVIALSLLWMDRQKSEIISKDSDANLNFNRSKKRMRASAWNWMAGLSVLLVWGTGAAMEAGNRGMNCWLAGMIVYTVLILVIAVRCEWKIIKLRRKMMTSTEGYDGEETYWFFGALVYYNPEDRHFLVENRIGSGYSVNLGSAAGKVFAGLMGVLVVFCLIGVPILVGREEYTPVGLELKEDTLCAVHTGIEYEIPEEEIASVSLIRELPEMSRRNGTGLPNLLKGRFRTEDRQDLWLCLNPENSEFLKVETTDERTYLFSGNTDVQTEEIYRKLSETAE